MLAAANEFEVLELEVKFTSAADVEKAYKCIAKFVHPDKAPPDYRDKATEAFKKLADAKDALSDPIEQRKVREKIAAEAAAAEAA